MRRLFLCLIVSVFSLSASFPGQHVSAMTARDTAAQTYRSDSFGVTFQYPAGWKLQEEPATQTITVSSVADQSAIQAGQPPNDLIFSIAFSTFRQSGAEQIADFADRLTKLAATPNATAQPVRIGGADGLSVDVLDGTSGVAGRSAMLSIGQRRVAVIRGIATIKAWASGDKLAQTEYTALISTLSFFPPANAISEDQIGRVLWAATNPGFGTFADIGATADGTAILATDPTNGVWTIGANGAVGTATKYAGIGTYGTLGMFRDGTRYIADAANHAIWLIQANGTIKKLIGGSVGSARGQFGQNSPSVFAFGYDNTLNILDNTDTGTRIQIFGRGGDVLTSWDIDPVQNGALSTDANGYVYIVGSNLTGILKISASGHVVTKNLGQDALTGMTPLAVVVDRFGNIYVATADSGVIKLSADGILQGVIGEPYDEAAAPKAGQLGKPVALALGNGDNILYIADAGKHPQIVAIALNGNAAISLSAGTQTAGAISYGQTVNGQITAQTFMNTYTFDGKAGEVVTITMRAASGSPLDAYVDLLGTDQTRIAANDDAPASAGLGSTDAQIAGYKLPYNGTYTIRATRFGRETSSGTGAYTLQLSK